MSHSAYAQNDNDVVAYTSEQKTLSGDLENDPLAQTFWPRLKRQKNGFKELKS